MYCRLKLQPRPARKTNGLAIAALVPGITSFLPSFAICSIPVIILGAITLNQIKKEPAIEGKEWLWQD